MKTIPDTQKIPDRHSVRDAQAVQDVQAVQDARTYPGGEQDPAPAPDRQAARDTGCPPARLSARPASPDPMSSTSPALPQGRVLPLYIRVAQWIMALGRPVSRDEIARQFGSTPRRSADMMFYMITTGAHLVEAERFLSKKEGRGRHTALIRVTMVWPELYTPSRPGRPRGSYRVNLPPEPVVMPELRDLFLGRRSARGAS